MLPGDDEVVEYGEVDRFAGERKAAGDASVGRAGGRIAAGVVVGEDYARAAVDRGVGDDLPKREIGTAIVAVMARQMDAAGLIVDMGDP